MKVFHHSETFARVIPSLESHWVGQSPFSEKKKRGQATCSASRPQIQDAQRSFAGSFPVSEKVSLRQGKSHCLPSTGKKEVAIGDKGQIPRAIGIRVERARFVETVALLDDFAPN